MTQQELEIKLREAELIRSSRKTLAIEVRPDGTIRIRAPRFCTNAEIRHFVQKNRAWIAGKLEMAEQRQQRKSTPEGRPFTEHEIHELAERALRELPPRIRQYAELMGVTYGRVTIRSQRTRWGSCSSRGNLNFNCLLMLTPPEVQDYVIVHELAHRLEMNHSPRFWRIVEEILPDYRKRKQWLRKEGAVLIERLRQG